MPEQNFEWNDVKNLSSQRKHGVSFEEAQYAFLEENVSLLKTSSIAKLSSDITVLAKTKMAKVF